MNTLDILTKPWAIGLPKYQEIIDIYSAYSRSGDVEAAAGRLIADEQSHDFEVVNNVAIVPIDGILMPNPGFFARFLGAVSTQEIGRNIQEAVESPDVEAIILAIDSPGGTVDGTVDLSNTVFEARKAKPVVTLAQNMMASAALWIGTASGNVFVANSTTQVGSIGVVATHVDRSESLKQRGLKVSEIFAGRFKRIASENRPLSKQGKEAIQAEVDFLYSLFVQDVARNLDVSEDTVLSDMADGRMFIGQQAIDAGLAQGVVTLDELVDRMAA